MTVTYIYTEFGGRYKSLLMKYLKPCPIPYLTWRGLRCHTSDTKYSLTSKHEWLADWRRHVYDYCWCELALKYDKTSNHLTDDDTNSQVPLTTVIKIYSLQAELTDDQTISQFILLLDWRWQIFPGPRLFESYLRTYYSWDLLINLILDEDDETPDLLFTSINRKMNRLFADQIHVCVHRNSSS